MLRDCEIMTMYCMYEQTEVNANLENILEELGGRPQDKFVTPDLTPSLALDDTVGELVGIPAHLGQADHVALVRGEFEQFARRRRGVLLEVFGCG